MAKTEYIGRAPMRFDAAGSYSDVPPFSTTEGGCVVNFALKKYATVAITPRTDRHTMLISKDMNEMELVQSDEQYNISGRFALVKAILKYFNNINGLNVTTHVDAPVGSGLGASASLAVATIGCLRSMQIDTVNPEALATDALYVENEMLENINGGQDQYAAAFGGVNFFSFTRDGVEHRPINIEADVISEIESKSLLVHSGQSRVSGNVLSKIMSDYKDNIGNTPKNLRNLKESALQMVHSLEIGDVGGFGEMLRKVYRAQADLHHEVVTPSIQKIFAIAEAVGLEGGKIAGAGAGGGVFLYSEPDLIQIISEKLHDAGYETIPFQVSQTGYSNINSKLSENE